MEKPALHLCVLGRREAKGPPEHHHCPLAQLSPVQGPPSPPQARPGFVSASPFIHHGRMSPVSPRANTWMLPLITEGEEWAHDSLPLTTAKGLSLDGDGGRDQQNCCADTQDLQEEESILARRGFQWTTDWGGQGMDRKPCFVQHTRQGAAGGGDFCLLSQQALPSECPPRAGLPCSRRHSAIC